VTASKDMLDELHNAVGVGLLALVKSGEATAAEYGQAIKFLKDNGIETGDNGGTRLEELNKAILGRLPFSDSTNPVSH
jgi:hypothetical protein